MASGPEMMFKTVFKALGLDGEAVMKQIESIRATIGNVGSSVAFILSLLLMANRRLHRIETHLALSDIEPIPTQITVINNEDASFSVAALGSGNRADG